MIPIFSNTLGVEELAAVTRVFASRWLGPGKERELFEQELAAYWNTDRVLATNSCTSRGRYPKIPWALWSTVTNSPFLSGRALMKDSNSEKRLSVPLQQPVISKPP